MLEGLLLRDFFWVEEAPGAEGLVEAEESPGTGPVARRRSRRSALGFLNDYIDVTRARINDLRLHGAS